MRILATLTLIALTTPTLAFGWDPRSLRVTQDGGNDFTVQYRSSAELTDYWCAAGDFVANKLGLSERTRVYRLSPPPRRQGQGISFTLDADRSAGVTGLTTFGGPQDGSFSAAVAISQFCVFDPF